MRLCNQSAHTRFLFSFLCLLLMRALFLIHTFILKFSVVGERKTRPQDAFKNDRDQERSKIRAPPLLPMKTQSVEALTRTHGYTGLFLCNRGSLSPSITLVFSCQQWSHHQEKRGKHWRINCKIQLNSPYFLAFT